MNNRHFPYWPKRLSKTLTVPETTIVDHLETTASATLKKPLSTTTAPLTLTNNYGSKSTRLPATCNKNFPSSQATECFYTCKIPRNLSFPTMRFYVPKRLLFRLIR